MSVELGLFPPSWYSLFRVGAIRNVRDWAQRISRAGAEVFFFSFEDALWRYLSKFPLRKKNIMVPDFFCTDVTRRLEERGYSVCFYRLDENLKFQQEHFLNVLSHHGDIGAAIIYYPLGDRSSVPPIAWFRETLGETCLLIEDCADCILDTDHEPESVKVSDRYHLIIDSLRKNLPLQGSRMFSCLNGDELDIPLSGREVLYIIKASVLHIAYSLLHLMSDFYDFKIGRDLKWHLFGVHSDLIGSFPTGARMGFLTRAMFSGLNLQTLKDSRGKVMQHYQRVADVTKKQDTPLIPISDDFQRLREIRFPVLRGKKSVMTHVAYTLEADGIYTDIHFDDSPLAEESDFLLLPLHPRYTEKEVQAILQATMARLGNS